MLYTGLHTQCKGNKKRKTLPKTYKLNNTHRLKALTETELRHLFSKYFPTSSNTSKVKKVLLWIPTQSSNLLLTWFDTWDCTLPNNSSSSFPVIPSDNFSYVHICSKSLNLKWPWFSSTSRLISNEDLAFHTQIISFLFVMKELIPHFCTSGFLHLWAGLGLTVVLKLEFLIRKISWTK